MPSSVGINHNPMNRVSVFYSLDCLLTPNYFQTITDPAKTAVTLLVLYYIHVTFSVVAPVRTNVASRIHHVCRILAPPSATSS
jgi:hypothetical protein